MSRLVYDRRDPNAEAKTGYFDDASRTVRRLICWVLLCAPAAVFWVLLLRKLPNASQPNLFAQVLHVPWGMSIVALTGLASFGLVCILIRDPERLLREMKDSIESLTIRRQSQFEERSETLPRMTAALFFVILGCVIVTNAWVCDDAFLTLRTVDNFLNGRGLTWNVDERVQIYTHPLWLFVLSCSYSALGEAFFAAILPAIITSLLAVWILAFGLARSRLSAVVVLVVLFSSKAFVDYSTSGLENPMTHLLLAVFFSLILPNRKNSGSLFLICFVFGLVPLNRMDSILLIAPAFVVSMHRYLVSGNPRLSRRDSIGVLLYAMLPLLTWELFSLFYYGSPFPNTAYAKLHNGVSQADLLVQGVAYYRNSASWDPVTLGVIAAALVASVSAGSRSKLLPAGLGIILYGVYILCIGGDFMSGRFFTGPLFLSSLILSQVGLSDLKSASLAVAVVLLVGTFNPRSPLAPDEQNPSDKMDAAQIADERLFYVEEQGLINVIFRGKSPKMGSGRPEALQPCQRCGVESFEAGPTQHSLDVTGLGDPLMARLEPGESWLQGSWRIGHFLRVVPGGYKQSLIHDQNNMLDDRLRQFYEVLRGVTRGDLLDLGRLKLIWRLNMGVYSPTLGRYVAESLAQGRSISLEDLGSPHLNGWPSWAGMSMGPGGVTIELGKMVRHKVIEISLDQDDAYELRFCQKSGSSCGQVEIGPLGGRGFYTHRLAVPEAAVTDGYDTIIIIPTQMKGAASIRHLRFP